MTYWQIFWRTFAALAAAALLAAQGYDWASGYETNATQLGLGLAVALIGGAVAAGHAFAGSPATTALQKALRSGVQFLAGAAGALVINEVGDFVNSTKLVIPTLIGAVLAFGVTYFSNQEKAA